MAAAKYSSQYISDRFLPDKAIDLIDEAGSRVRLRHIALPEEARDLDKELKVCLWGNAFAEGGCVSAVERGGEAREGRPGQGAQGVCVEGLCAGGRRTSVCGVSGRGTGKAWSVDGGACWGWEGLVCRRGGLLGRMRMQD
eukprot:268681-Chlamydomonas_euryale.AAC.1